MVAVLASAGVSLAKSPKTETNTVYLRPISYDVVFDGEESIISGNLWHMIWVLQGPRRLSFAAGTEGYAQYELIDRSMTCPIASSSSTTEGAMKECQQNTLGACLQVTYDPVADVIVDIKKAQDRRCTEGSTY